MNLVIFHKDKSAELKSDSLLRFALTHDPAAGIMINAFERQLSAGCRKESSFFGKKHIDKTIYAIPEKWTIPQGISPYRDNIISYDDFIEIPSDIINELENNDFSDKWFIISNGRFFPQIGSELLSQISEKLDHDIVMINADPELMSESEKVQLTSTGQIAGFRRLYCDSARFTPLSNDWPHLFFIKIGALKKIISDDALALSFSTILKKSRQNNLSIRAINIGGSVLDLEKEDNFLQFYGKYLTNNSDHSIHNYKKISADTKIVGNVFFGKDVHIGSKAVIIGPSVICDGSKIEDGSVVISSIIGNNIHVLRDYPVHNRIIKEQQEYSNSCKNGNCSKYDSLLLLNGTKNKYRYWPKFSYTACFKRIADIFAAIIILILFAPLVPFIAAAIKLTSSGSVFYKDKRQGLHGKEFYCLKFRTMLPGANRIQENLRYISQVDGPQFKMDDDPRISGVGRFLRETYIDEIPQFFNVLLGQMSVVGPRPSPESENTLCPFWREARLSVKPGITGLWQIYRTRRPMKDFQEWIYYDIEYVKNLSIKMDIKICFKTAKKLIDNFISQF